MTSSERHSMGSSAGFAEHWPFDPEILHLNHGSFGACPLPVLETQTRLRRRLERNAVGFFLREMEGLVDSARRELAAFVGASPETLVFVVNTTTGVNTVLRSFALHPGDEILASDHEYNACRNALEFAAERSGAHVVVAHLPFPIDSPDAAIEAIMGRVTSRTRLALLDHVTSPTALVLPAQQLVRELEARGIDTIIDGAHAPGMLPLNLQQIGAAYYTGNCHKWLCAPKGAAFLHVRRDKQPMIRPLVISHGANSPRTDRSRFWLEFDWTGTHDPSPYLSLPEAIRFMGSLLPGGWPSLRAHNHELALEGRRILCEALGMAPPCPEEMIGSMAALVLEARESSALKNITPGDRLPHEDPLERLLFERHRIVVAVIPWQDPPLRFVRISAQIYNHPDQYRRLAEALKEALG